MTGPDRDDWDRAEWFDEMVSRADLETDRYRDAIDEIGWSGYDSPTVADLAGAVG